MKDNKGITLIALVITIIVLLILAGVTIVTLTGKNGILSKGNSAKEKTEKESIIEQARTEILAVQSDNEGKLTKAQIIEVLEKFFQKETIPNEKELPEDMSKATQSVTAKEEYGSYKISIAQIWNGKFSKEEGFNPETFTLGTEAQNTEKYGWKVKDYTVKTEEFTTGVWKLFYQDDNYTYIIADECVGNYRLYDYNGNYKSGAEVSLVGQKLNPEIQEYFVETKKTSNLKSTAWLMDSEVWKMYTNKDAVFAIGSPTVELFALSYNSTGKENKIEAKNGWVYGYTQNTENGWIKTEENHGIYNKSIDKKYWLASPGNGESTNRDSTIIGVNGEDGCLEFLYDYNYYPIRPVVCIPTSVFESKYAKSLVDE